MNVENEVVIVKKKLGSLKSLSSTAQIQSLYPFCSFDEYKEWFKWIPQDYFFSYLKRSYNDLNINTMLIEPKNINFYKISEKNEMELTYKDVKTTINYHSPFKIYPDYLTSSLTYFRIKIETKNKKIEIKDWFKSWNPKTGELLIHRQTPDNQVFQFRYNLYNNAWIRSETPYGNPTLWSSHWNAYKLQYFYIGFIININSLYHLTMIKKKNIRYKIASEDIYKTDPHRIDNVFNDSFIIPFFNIIKEFQNNFFIFYVATPFDKILRTFLKYNDIKGYDSEFLPNYKCINIRTANNKIVSFRILITLNNKKRLLQFINYDEVIPTEFAHNKKKFLKENNEIINEKNIKQYMTVLKQDFDAVIDFIHIYWNVELREYLSFKHLMIMLLKKPSYDKYNFPLHLHNFNNYFTKALITPKFPITTYNSYYSYSISFFDLFITENFPIPFLYTHTTTLYNNNFKIDDYGFIEYKNENKKRIWFLDQFKKLKIKITDKGEWKFHHFTSIKKPFTGFMKYCNQVKKETTPQCQLIVDYILNNFLDDFRTDPSNTSNFITPYPIEENMKWIYPISNDLNLYHIQNTIPSYRSTKKNKLMCWVIEYYKTEYLKKRVKKILLYENNQLHVSEPLTLKELKNFNSLLKIKRLT